MTTITTDGLPHDYEIVRFREIPRYATLGRLFDAKGIELCVTIDRPWLDADGDGKRDAMKSRFVGGLYRVEERKSHLHGGTGKRDYDVLEYQDVPDIVAGQLHIANWPWELHGCTALGSAFGHIQYRGKTVSPTADPLFPRMTGRMYYGVSGSTAAFNKVLKDVRATMEREKRDHVWIRITDRIPIAS